MSSTLIRPELVRLGASPASKAQAIREAGQLLAAAGHIDPAYVDSLLARENVANTYLGHGVAIPHGMIEDRHLIRSTAIAVLQVPGGIEWNPGQTVHLVFAIAAQSDEHLALLRRLTRLLQDEAALAGLLDAVLEARGDQGPPVFLKVAPDLEPADIEAIARIAIDKQLGALIVSNTTISRPPLQSRDAGETGGLSGAPLS